MMHGKQRRLISIVMLMAIAGIAVVTTWQPVESGTIANDQRAAPQQDAVTSTPAPVLLPSSTASATADPPTSTRTPTSQGPAYVSALNPDANVRSGPGLDFDRLGTIQPGEQYIILGRLSEWFQIEFPLSPTRVAWVFSGVVQVFGDEDRILDLSQEQLPTIDPNIAAAAETQLAITLTPGGLLTLTAQAQGQTVPDGIFTATPAVTTTLAPGERLPTFTPLAATYTTVPLDQFRGSASVNVGQGEEPFAPAIPVLGLIGLGLVGLLVSLLRRV